MSPSSDLRAEAEALARQLPNLNFKAEASEAAHIGSAGRRRAGTGEQFWQYRRHTQEDAADRVDWRRSAKGSDLFVRETELETARTVLFWCDPHPGFNWKGDGDIRTKADEARLLMLTLGLMMSKDGERIGALGAGRTPSFGKRAVDRLAEDISNGAGRPFPPPPRASATLVIASDFYDPIPEWQARLKPLAAKCPEGGAGRTRLPVPGPREAASPGCRDRPYSWTGRNDARGLPAQVYPATRGPACTGHPDWLAPCHAYDRHAQPAWRRAAKNGA